MKVKDLKRILADANPEHEVEIMFRHDTGNMFLDLAEVQEGIFTRITDLAAYDQPLVERSEPTCRMIFES